MVAAVPMTPTLPFCVMVIARRQAGSTVPMIGMLFSSVSRSSATDETVLQAMTMAFTPLDRKKRMICSEKRITVSWDFVP